MRAVVYKGKGEVAVEDVEDPKIEDSKDAIIRLTSSAVCGSDLHMYESRTTLKPGKVLGHEPLGVIEEIGDGVTSFKEGDRVVVTFNVACGYCINCVKGFTSACLTTNPKQPGGAFGYANMGPYAGAQAEYLRVPFADFNCIKLPGSPGDKWEDDFVLLADIFPTAFYANVLAMVLPGDLVAVFGAGPVGLLSAYSALRTGASMVFVVDYIPVRLQKAQEIGAIPIDYTKGDPVTQIQAKLAADPAVTGRLLPGEEKMAGVTCGIDAVGYQARDRSNPSKENPTQVIDDLVRLVNATGHLGLIGVFEKEDPGGATEEAKEGTYMIPLGKIWSKGLSIGTGQTPVKKFALMLRDQIVGGKASPSLIVSHRISIDEAPDFYRNFDKRIGDYVKGVIKFGK